MFIKDSSFYLHLSWYAFEGFFIPTFFFDSLLFQVPNSHSFLPYSPVNWCYSWIYPIFFIFRQSSLNKNHMLFESLPLTEPPGIFAILKEDKSWENTNFRLKMVTCKWWYKGDLKGWNPRVVSEQLIVHIFHLVYLVKRLILLSVSWYFSDEIIIWEYQ